MVASFTGADGGFELMDGFYLTKQHFSLEDLSMLYILFFAYCVSWIFSMIGNVAKQLETVSGTSMMMVYPLLFSSNVLVDVWTMPKWLQVVIEINPISNAVSLTRGLFHGTVQSVELAAGLGICILLLLIFAPLTVYIYLKRQIR